MNPKNNPTWKIYLSEKRNRIILFVSLLTLALTLLGFLHFLTFNEGRVGYLFHDPVLSLFSPFNISLFTFIVTYSLVLYGIASAFKTPVLLVRLLQGYMFMTLLRMACLYFVPLEPPADIIPLYDAFLKLSFYSGRDNLKDLFFSGHTATMFLFAFAFEDKKLKIIFTSGAILVGMLVLLQHVHYSIDVVAAPFVSWTSLKIQEKINYI